MGKGSNTSTSTSSPNPQAMQSYQDLLTRASGVASTPYQSYSGELVAPQNQQQNTGVAGINQYANFAQPYIQQAAGMATNAASPITAQQIQQYESPYTQQVVQATQNQFNNQNAQQQQGVISNAAQQGALGGNRVGITQANMANQQQLAQAPVIAGLENQGYQTGLNTALTEQQAQAAGAYSLGNLGVSGQNAGLTGAAAQFGAGTSQQQTQQAQDTALYQQFMNQLAYPYQQTQWLAGIDTGVGSQMGGTSSTTGPAPNQTAQLVGLGLSALGASLKRGGRVPGFNGGGGVAHFDTGGGVAGMSGVPYGGGHSWIPGMNITHGQGAPRPPGNQQQQLPSLAQQGKQIGDLAGKLLDTQNNPLDISSSEQGGFSPASEGAMQPIGASPETFSPTDFSGSEGAIFNRGGSVGRYAAGGIANLPTRNRIMVPRRFADGGSPYDDGIPFDPTVGGIAPDQTQFNVDPSVSKLERDVYLNSGAPLPQSVGFDLGDAGPRDGSSPLDTAEWPSGPMNAPGIVADRNAPSPLDTAHWPEGPVGAPADFSDRFGGEPLPPRPAMAAPTLSDQGVSGADVPLGPLTSPGFGGQPSKPITGTEAIPSARATDITTQTAGYADNMDRIAAAHRKIESADRNNPNGNYSALGPVNPKTGDRAYGAYQVMGANIPKWTKEILGHSLTPQQFLASNEAQDAVYKAKMGSYIGQLGLPGAVHAWLGPGSKDFTGTTQAQYLNRFAAALNGTPAGADREPGTRVAGDGIASDGAVLPPGAIPAQHVGSNGVAPERTDFGLRLLSPAAKTALMSAGFGMMASQSPFLGTAIGQGGQQGLQTYSTMRQQEAGQHMNQQKIDLEAKKLAQTADLEHEKLALETRPYTEMTAYQKAQIDSTNEYRKSLAERGNYRPSGAMTEDGHPILSDTRSGDSIDAVTGEAVQAGTKVVPMSRPGAKSSLAHELIADREKQRATDPSLPPLSLEEATALAQRAPNADANTIRKLNLAAGAWKAWTGNPINMGNKKAPENTLEYWEQRYGVSPTGGLPPAAAGAAPPAAARPPAAAPAAPAAAAPPPRPPGVPVDARPQRSKSTGAVRWVAADGSVYSADGVRQ